jgi:SAM-dependent methyltransferase
MSLRFHEIAEGAHPILNPFSSEKLDLLGSILNLDSTIRILDLACGKGEMLIRWASEYSIRGVGVDISDVFLASAHQRAYMMNVGDRVNFVHADASSYPESHHEFDLISCLGASWIGGGLSGTLDLMRQALTSSGGVLLVGEPFWIKPPPAEALSALGIEPDTFTSLGGTLGRFEEAGVELVEMILADTQDFDRYESRQWLNVHQFLAENETFPEAEALRSWMSGRRANYLNIQRDYLGWGVFVLEVPPVEKPIKPVIKVDHDAPIDFRIDSEMLWVWLADGRVIGNPLTWYGWLKNAPDEAKQAVEFDTLSITWVELGQNIRIQDMLSRHN